VENWSTHHFSNLSAVVGRTGLVLVGGETDLIVHYDVDDASCSVVLEVLHFKGLIYNTLTCHCCIAVDKHSYSLLERLLRDFFLDGSDSSID
jgi:hypothetical protein